LDSIGEKIFLLLLGALAGAIINHQFATARERRREAAGRRHAFRGVLRIQVEKFESVNWKQLHQGQLLQMHRDSIASIIDETTKIVDDIPKRRRAQFNTVRLTYCSLGPDDVEPHDLSAYPENPTGILFPCYDIGLKKITGLLHQMMELAR
jgi:hypothetical protein